MSAVSKINPGLSSDFSHLQLRRPILRWTRKEDNIAGTLTRLGRGVRALAALHLEPSQLIHSGISTFYTPISNRVLSERKHHPEHSCSSRSTCSTLSGYPGVSFDPNPAVPGRMGKLDFKDPVPADIDIAQSVEPTPISEIAKKLQISAEDFEPHGTTKAKVST